MATSLEPSGDEVQPQKAMRKDALALWIGLAFCLVFTGIIWLTGYWLSSVPHLADRGSSWYFWKLPAATFAGRFSAWGLYLLHQCVFWGLIWYAQTRVKKYTAGLHRINFLALGINALFIVLHIIQTQLWYDGLAQDVSIASSQYSVIALLVWVVLMENNRRGMIWGKRLPISQRVIQWARKYHGYFFAWAAIYTFWFHPAENTPGHLIGFFYMFMILLQGSLFFTRIHMNKYWTVAIEALVLVHGTIVAVWSGGKWPQFFFGFFGVVVLTLVHGLPIKRWLKWVAVGCYIGGVIIVYGLLHRDLALLPRELAIIPLTYYASAIGGALVVWSGWWLYDRFHPQQPETTVEAGE